MAKNLKLEKELPRVDLEMILDGAVKRSIFELEPTDSHDFKIEYAHRVLAHDKIAALPKGQDTLPKISHRIAMRAKHPLPDNHALLR